MSTSAQIANLALHVLGRYGRLSCAAEPIVKRVAPRTCVGWFVPNSADLRACLLGIVRSGKRIHVEPLVNGPVKFYAEEVV